jgi:hypothetical protein
MHEDVIRESWLYAPAFPNSATKSYFGYKQTGISWVTIEHLPIVGLDSEAPSGTAT